METVSRNQLEYLNSTMKDTLQASNSFLLKYHFGGIIAIIGLLNADLFLLTDIVYNIATCLLLLLVAGLVVLLANIYFGIVLKEYCRYLQSHRKLKYKYELTLHLLLCEEKKNDYQLYLEKSFDSVKYEMLTEKEIKNGEGAVFAYLYKHHLSKFHRIPLKTKPYHRIAMVIICLTIIIRVMLGVIQEVSVSF